MPAGMTLYVDLNDKASKKIDYIDSKFGRFKKNVVGGSVMMRKGYSRVSGSVGKLSGRFRSAAMVAKIGLAGIAAAAVITGAKFEHSMAEVGSVAGANAAQMKELSATARHWGNITAFSASEAAKGMYSLASAGQSVAQIKASIGGTLMFAGAANTNLAQATETVVQSLKMFQLEASQTNRVVNVFAAGISASMLTAGRLQDALAQVGATANASGMELEKTVATLGALHNSGIVGAKSGTLLKNVLVRLQDPNQEMAKLLGEVNLKTHGLAGTMQHLAERMKEPSQAFAAFGRIAAPAALSLMVTGAEGLNAMTDAVTGTQKAVEMYNRLMKTTSSKAKIVKSVLQENMIAVFNQLKPIIVDTLDYLAEGLRKAKPYIVGITVQVKQWVNAHRELIKSTAGVVIKIGAVLAVVYTLSSVIGMIGSILSPIIGILQILAGAATTAFGILASAGLPVIAGIAAIAAIIGVVIYHYKQLKDRGYSTLQAIGGAFQKTGENIVDLFKWVWKQVEHGLGAAILFIADKLTLLMQKLGFILEYKFPGITANIAYLRSKIQNELGDVTAHLKKDWGGVWDFVKEKANNTGGAIGDKYKEIKDKIKSVISTTKEMGDAAGNIDMGGSTLGEADGKGTELTGEQKAQLKRQLAALAKIENEEKASLMKRVNYRATYTKDWLNAKTKMIENNYQDQLVKAEGNAVAIAQAEIQRDNAIRDAKIRNQEAIRQHWIQNHQLEMAMINSLAAGWDTFYTTLFDKQKAGKERREQMWADMKSSFIRQTSEMMKRWIVEQLKALLIAESAKKKAHAKEKFRSAKEGAVKAYSAFAGIPLVGPALGAAAAAAAFAFLIAFHKGGMVEGGGSGEMLARLIPGEYVVNPQATRSIGRDNLEYMNETGRIPAAVPAGGGNTFQFQIGSGSGGMDDEQLRTTVREKVMPFLEDLFGTGEFVLDKD